MSQTPFVIACVGTETSGANHSRPSLTLGAPELADAGAYTADKVDAVGKGCVLGTGAGQATRAVGSALARKVLQFNGYTAAASCLIGGAKGAAG